MIDNFPELWMRMVCTRSVESVLSLYRPNAVLVATYNKDILRGHAQLASYFRRFLGKDDLCGRIDGVIEQDLGTVKVLSGTYTFHFREGGRPKAVKARYTFVLTPENVRTGRIWAGSQRWRIVNHHSSEVPD